MLKCPVCSSELVEIQKFNVYIDVCQNCKGIWLDRGELEKILEIVKQEKIVTEPKEYRKKYNTERGYHSEHSERHRYEELDYHDEYYYKAKKKAKKEKISKIIETIFKIFD